MLLRLRRSPFVLLVGLASLGTAASLAHAFPVGSAKPAASTGKAPLASVATKPTATTASPSAKPAAAASAKPSTSSSAKPTSSAVPSPVPSGGSVVKPKPIAGGAKPSGKPAGKGPIAKKSAVGWASPAYVAMVKQWHLATDGKPPVDTKGRPKLVLYSINRNERVELAPSTDKGDFAPSEIDKASFILRSGDGHEHPIDGHLLDIVYELQRHFKSGEIRFVSGYRTPTKRLGSNHGYGRAMDLVVPGTVDEWVASYVRAMGFTGAGTYPISGFVHVDVRERSFYWVDKSGPGAPNKTTGVLPGDALSSDAKARKEGKIPPSPAPIGRDVDAAIAARSVAVSGAAVLAPNTNLVDEAEDDDEMDDGD